MTYTATLLTSSLGSHTTIELPHNDAGRTHAFLRTTVDPATGAFRVWERVTAAEGDSASYAVLGDTGPAFPLALRQSLESMAGLAYPLDVNPE